MAARSLIAFQADGRPVIHPDHMNDPTSVYRVEESKILLNIDHPDFNSKREQLFHDISDDVRTYEDLEAKSPARVAIQRRMARRLSSNAPFSVAARHYIRFYQDRDWIVDLLNAPQGRGCHPDSPEPFG
jgi:hypothetical protein